MNDSVTTSKKRIIPVDNYLFYFNSINFIIWCVIIGAYIANPVISKDKNDKINSYFLNELIIALINVNPYLLLFFVFLKLL